MEMQKIIEEWSDTIEHFKDLYDIAKSEGIKSALKYDILVSECRIGVLKPKILPMPIQILPLSVDYKPSQLPEIGIETNQDKRHDLNNLGVRTTSDNKICAQILCFEVYPNVWSHIALYYSIEPDK